GAPGPAPAPGRRARACGRPARSCRLLPQPGFERRVGGRDHRAAEAVVAVVQDHRLAGGDGALGAVETHPQGAVFHAFDLAGLGGLAVAHLRAAGEAARGRVAHDPVRRLAPQGGGLQPGAVVPLVHVQQVASDVLADHVPGCLVAAADAAELQAAALAQGEMEHARVLAERASARVADLARARGDVARQELAEVALAYEA